MSRRGLASASPRAACNPGTRADAVQALRLLTVLQGPLDSPSIPADNPGMDAQPLVCTQPQPLQSDDTPRNAPLNAQVPRCTAHSKRTGKPCNNPAVRGSTKCRMHGGNSRKGIASGTFKHGGYSQHLPTSLQSAFDQFRDDPLAVALREELALLRTRTTELLARLTTGESGSLWTDLHTVQASLASAVATGDQAAISQASASLASLTAAAGRTEETWAQLQEAVASITKTVSAEARRQHDAAETVTRAELQAVIVAICSVIRDHVTDPQTLRAVADGIRRLKMLNHPTT